jgi:hypothetical protein
MKNAPEITQPFVPMPELFMERCPGHSHPYP